MKKQRNAAKISARGTIQAGRAVGGRRATRAVSNVKPGSPSPSEAMPEDQCTFQTSPYKGYAGRAKYDFDADLFHGQVIGTRDVITFQAKSVPELRKAFEESVDDYLAFCEERGESPERPYSGRFITRIDPSLHRQISVLAEASGKSLNSLVEEWLLRLPHAVNELTERLESTASSPP